jgi:hypothetical protein
MHWHLFSVRLRTKRGISEIELVRFSRATYRPISDRRKIASTVFMTSKDPNLPGKFGMQTSGGELCVGIRASLALIAEPFN